LQNPNNVLPISNALETCMAKRRNLEQVFEALEDGIVAVTKDGKIFHMNTAATRLLGGNLRSRAGKNIDEILSERCGREVRLVQRAIGSRKPSPPERFQLKAGENDSFSVIARVQLLSDGTGLLGAVVVLRDETEISRLRAHLEGTRGLEDVVGASEPMQQVFQLVREVARTDATVLIQGETGTGKELVARAIHQLSRRADRPLITVNCAALPEGLLESELFGHVKGAFTGALGDRVGRFEAADGGTLFLDEVAEIPPVIQVKLLRVLQERVFERVGENKPRRTDARLISATNKNLSEMVSEGRFREDLFYRLNVFPIRVPSLRERVDDIPLLVHRLLSRIADRHGGAVPGITDDVLRLFRSYRWPGNVRELQAALEYAMIRSQGATIDVHHLPPSIVQPSELAVARNCILDEQAIRMALEKHHYNRTAAAKELGISRITLWRRMRDWGIPPRTGANANHLRRAQETAGGSKAPGSEQTSPVYR